MSATIRSSGWFKAVTLVCLSVVQLASIKIANAQAVVCQSQNLTVLVDYETVLKRLDGEQASRKMFASQHLDLLQYVPRQNGDKPETEPSKVVAQIDILGRSCEYGLMRFLLSVQADDHMATIEVSLVEPVGMLRFQSYKYTITPETKTTTTIKIEHTLDVVLMKRRMEAINRIIEKVTYKKACEQLTTLTASMTACVKSIIETNDSESAKEANHEESEDEAGKSTDNQPDMAADGEKAAIIQEKPEENRSAPQVTPADVTLSDIQKSTQVEQGNATESPLQPDSSPSDQNPALTRPMQDETKVPASEPKDENKPSENKPSDNKPDVTKAVETKPVETKPDTLPNENKPDTKKQENSVVSKEPDSQPAAKAEPKEQVLRLTIEGVSRGSGTMRIALFDSEKQYLAFDARKEESKQGDAFRKEAIKVSKSGKFVHEFRDVPFGRYVIAAFHDQDGNNKLTASLIGMPSEPYGFSRNARGTLGAPSFGDAIITFDRDHTEFSFRVK